MVIVYLETTTWGMSYGGGSHYYGRLVAGNTRLELEYSLSEQQAIAFNDLERGKYKPWKAGDKTSRFDSEQDVIDAAILEYNVQFNGVGALVHGSRAYCEPHPCLAGEFKSKLNDLYTRFMEAKGGRSWEGRWDTYGKFSDEWQKVTAEIGEE
jgi:hypothetical protein